MSTSTLVKKLSMAAPTSILNKLGGAAAAIAVGTVVASPVQATTLYSQTNIVTNPGAGFNGEDVSQASATVNSAGQTVTGGFRLAQSFTIANPGLWQIDTVSVMAYMTSNYGFPPASPFTGISVNIWDNAPGSAGSNILGSSTTLQSTDWTEAYRTFNGVLNNNQRPVMNIAAAFTGLNLSAGNYWVDYALTGTSPTGGTTAFTPFLMTTSGGQPATLTGNARQFIPTTSQWVTISNGNPAQGVSLPLTVTGRQVPEPASVLGLLAVGALGVTSGLKRKQQQEG